MVKMKADFSGYATKAGLKCSDGRTIQPDAFKHQDQMRVPLVWQHGHSDPENVLGHAILENRKDGVYTYGFFNSTKKAEHARNLVEHDDINMLSIWANQLIERAGNVLHGTIREVSLVLSGANPGAIIENVTIRHSDGDDVTLDDEVIIYTGLELEHADSADDATIDDAEETIQDVYDSLNDKQKEMVHSMLGEALSHADGDTPDETDETIQDVYDSMNEKQKQVLHFMLGEAITASKAETEIKQDNVGDDTNKEGSTMKHNVFEDQGTKTPSATLSHDDMKSIMTSAVRGGSLKAAIDDYALAHGITDIDVLFPDAKSIQDTPEWDKRRTEWVATLIGSARKSPFSRIKTRSADITMEEARAKGYVTGALKKEEFFSVKGRTTTPTTVYKKQALDRDDVVDITDFDVVTWMKGEMRLMLDEEIGRAVLLGDGRDISSEDKIDEQCIRPIAKDHELYTTTVNVNVDDASSTMNEVIDAVILNRYKLKGTGTPNFYTTEYWIARFLTLRDTLGHRIYRNLQELAVDLRVNEIIAVEVMQEEPDIVGILVNPVDYTMGADKGGEINMFDDFDIDYNKLKYLIETRMSGCLNKLKSAMVIKRVASTDVLVTPVAPTFNTATGVLSITNTTGVVYKNGVTVVNAAGSPYAAIAAGASVTIDATPATGYYFATSDDDSWTFTRDA
jgi:uncharacterized protein (UPF0297 family)